MSRNSCGRCYRKYKASIPYKILVCCNIGAFVYIEEILDEDCLGTHKYNINIKCPVDCKIKFDQITVRQSIEGETLFIMAYGDLIRC